jgi:ubiquinone/menaquinone biosynthesis C-methylase UbiE
MADPGIAYNHYADRYDALLEENRINRYMRVRMTESLVRTFPSGARLIELGCGTGDEALVLGARGCSIRAIDPSPEMIAIAREKALTRGQLNRVSFQVGYARDLGALLKEEPQGSFDGAYASFALSYEEDLMPVRTALSRLVRPGGFWVLAIMNRMCGVELIAAFLSAHPGMAGRRLRPSTTHKVGAVRTSVFSRTPLEVVKAFAPEFEPIDMQALPAVLPPAYANRVVINGVQLLDLLENIDTRIRTFPVVRSLGDHTVVRFRRTS